MNRNARSRNAAQRRRPSAARTAADMWREPGPLPEVEPIVPAVEATALIRSLGEPPLVNGAEVAIRFATVVERTAMVATALASVGGVLATD
jgi:hypothetical protein